MAVYTQHILKTEYDRDGVTGKVLYEYPPYVGEARYHDTRVRRSVLQDALKSRVPSNVIQLQKRLVDIISEAEGGATALFEDGTSAHADLIIGADGIRSVSSDFFIPIFTADREAELLIEITRLFEKLLFQHTNQLTMALQSGDV